MKNIMEEIIKDHKNTINRLQEECEQKTKVIEAQDKIIEAFSKLLEKYAQRCSLLNKNM